MHRATLLALLVVMLLCVGAEAAALRQVAIIDIPGRPGFDELAFANGMLVMTHAGAGTVDIFDPVKRRLVAHITNMAQPRGIAVDEQAGKLYIGNAGSNSIVAVSFDGWKVEDIIQISVAPESLLLVPGSKRLYVVAGLKQSLMAVDLAANRELGSVQLDGHPAYLASDPARELLYVTLQDKKQVVALDPTLKIVKRFPLTASQPTGIVYDQKLDRIYVAVRSAVLSLNADTGVENARVAAPAGIDMLWLDNASRTLMAAGSGAIFTMSADSRLAARDEMSTDVKGHTLAFDPQKSLIYMPGGREGRSKLLILRQLDNAAAQQRVQNADATVGAAKPLSY
ncbi:MAG TPA: hypothetical protein VN622_14410 [Clostridia bacterium]|nr:hypothetical protein [Clostridia bacterium]